MAGPGLMGAPWYVWAFVLFVVWRVCLSLTRDLERQAAEERGERLPRSSPRATRPQVLYVLQNPATGLIKLGISDDTARRVRELENQGGVRLELLGEYEGGRRLERDLHSRLDHLREQGEWFRDHPDVRVELLLLDAAGRRL